LHGCIQMTNFANSMSMNCRPSFSRRPGNFAGVELSALVFGVQVTRPFPMEDIHYLQQGARRCRIWMPPQSYWRSLDRYPQHLKGTETVLVMALIKERKKRSNAEMLRHGWRAAQ